MKYIPAGKLKNELESIYDNMLKRIKIDKDNSDYWAGKADAYRNVIDTITSLQQEQPMPDSTKLIEFWNEDKEMLKEKGFSDDPWRLAYNAFMCGFGRGISVKRQEQPEVDLEKEIEKQIRSTFYDLDGIAIMGTSRYASVEDMEYIARHFYELGLNARKEK